jgi:hypothetical protein
LAADPEGRKLYVADSGNNAIRAVVLIFSPASSSSLLSPSTAATSAWGYTVWRLATQGKVNLPADAVGAVTTLTVGRRFKVEGGRWEVGGFRCADRN